MKHHHQLLLFALLVALLPAAALQAQPETAPAPYPARAAYAPRPLPDRIVLTGHDHTYARTGEVTGRSQDGAADLRAGYHQTYDPAVGAVYVVSVSGPGFQNIAGTEWAARRGEDTQL